ncbi:LLM class flavin-dependent oxidoreductase [Nocardioides nitrophenolicus]|uniref:LLM class flavin-dependent oxidoreductase n=1 Tax=Nocardioides nitrophenolicus TaxID=60489 RepID=UPI00195B0ECB|nr:LLM class flavin-dependent oxidoreductase [Nocardioides nitrophenolicus]MBM7517468.1 alkanesulfonate monooxygenase SsuD/methylene tetrahydromethanopterin reductase-like flavin-dependent oxidoreductase (luciferase family) [Nocardioides nitrophenolicus]
MKFGILLDHQYQPGDDLGRRTGEIVEYVQHVRDLGYDSVFGIHHYLSSLSTPQPLPLLSRLIEHSGEMELGTGILILPLGHPVHWAEEIATIDQMSGGRFVLGIGSGYREDEFASFGIERRTRVSRMNESLEVMRALWTGEKVVHHGKHFDLDGVRCSVLPAQEEIPVWVGANGPIGIERIARQGLPWLAPSNVRRNWAVGNLKDYRGLRAEAGFSDDGATFPIHRDLCVADSFDQAWEIAGEPVRRSYGEYVQYGMDYFESQWEGIKHKALFFGSPDDVAAKVQDFADAGYNHFVFRAQWLGLPIEESVRIVERFAREVMPRFRG